MPVATHDWNLFAPPPVEPGQLAPGEVRLWTARVPGTETDLAKLLRLLGPAEVTRAARFKVSAPRRQFVAGRVVLRQILGAFLRVEPASLAFGYQPAGKPFLLPPAANPDWRFNLSHSGEMLAVAVTCGREVGVDLEWIHGLENWADLESRIFSARELAELYALPPAQHRAAFFNGWTRKEAWLKATGEGLIDDLPAIEVTLAPGREPEWLSLPGGPDTGRQWSVQALALPPEYAGAVVVRNHSASDHAQRPPAITRVAG